MRWLWIAAMVGCSGADRLEELDGSWAGAASIINGSHMVYATFTYDQEGEYLAGSVLVEEPPGDRTYSLKRADMVSDVIVMDLLQSDGVQALDLDGSLNEGGDSFEGTITMTVECGAPAPCGWTGPFELNPGEPRIGLTTPITPPDTGGPPDTGPTEGTADTAAKF